VLGDFGICYVEDNWELTMTEEVMGSRFYCAPELRDGRVRSDVPQELADIYSLGKVLYWIFSKRVFDREDTYRDNPLAFELANNDTVVRPVEQMMAAALVDDLVSESVVADPNRRVIRKAGQFRARVILAADRVKVLGRPLDLRLPKRCVFCGEGEYKALHERTDMPLSGPAFPTLAARKAANPNAAIPSQATDPFERLKNAGDVFIFRGQRGFPLYLVCNICGNGQYFRLDLTDDRHGDRWKPQ
jgi:serine/threonine protein kinase